MPKARGTLVVVATPIGNLGDLSPRASDALRNADFWIVEDTRVSGKLGSVLETKKPMRVLNDHTRPDQVEKLAQEVAESASTALMSDAGTPLVSDPGAELVQACLRLGCEIDVVPGPSAVSAALVLSGFYAQRYAFLGYPPRKPGPLRELLAPYKDSTMTLVCFESPHRIGKFLAVCAEALGDRRYAVCREITKVHQQVWRSSLPNVPELSQVPAKGEVTVVIEGHRRLESVEDRV